MNVSLLIPRSVLYPSIGFDLVDGIRTGLQQSGAAAIQFDIQNIGLAAKDGDVFARCEQVLLNGADIVIAYINPATAEFVHSLFAANDKLLIVLDSGMHFSPLHKLSHAFFVSLQGALCCRVAARQAMQNGNASCAFTCSFFDAGYRGAIAFSSAAANFGGAIGFNHVTKLKRSEFDLAPLKQYLSEHPSNGVFAAFCGDMAEDFYRHGAELGLFASYPVFASPFVAEELWLDKIPYPGGNVMTAVTWGRELDNPENRAFMQVLNKPGKANIFSAMAWEAGYLLAQVQPGAGTDAIKDAWDQLEFDAPRGHIKMNAETGYLEAPVYKAEVTEGANGNCRLIIHEQVTFLEEEKELMHKDAALYSDQTGNSWFNAYPCIDS